MEDNIENNEEFEVELDTTNSDEQQVETEELQQEDTQTIEETVEKVPTEEEIQSRIDKAVETRLKRERRENERKNKSLYQIEDALKKGLGVEDRTEILKKLNDFYEIPANNAPNVKDEELLGKAYAQEIIDEGDIQEIKDEANRIASIPRDKRSARENAMFNALCEKLVSNKQENELKNNGIGLEILSDKQFNSFRSKLNSDVSILEAVDMFNRLKQTEQENKKEKPASPGSAKSKGTTADNVVKEFYTFEEAKQFSRDELNKRPKLFEAIKRSMPKW
nr:MAG TPA: hypothetical protein [Caudoviricetes sp.]